MKIAAHPEKAKFAIRLNALKGRFDTKFQSELYRFINPTHSKEADILNGTGSIHASGRWNLAGSIRLSYTAITPQTALTEVLAHVKYFSLPLNKAMPRVLVALYLKAHRALDLRNGEIRRALRLSDDTIRKLDWRAENQNGREAITQAWGQVFSDAGFEAVIVPSAADANSTNVLVFPNNLQSGSHFDVKSKVRWPGK